MDTSVNTTVTSPKISVLIPVYNDIDRIEACLSSLEKQSMSRDTYEIIVIDNGSTDGTYELLKQITAPSANVGFTVTQCLTPGSYAARNHGLTLMNGQYAAFTDSDCIVSAQWLTALLEVIESQPNAVAGDVIVAGKMTFFPDPNKHTEQSAIDFENLFSMKQDQNAQNGKCITANFFCSMALLQKYNGFDQKLKSGGDVELSTRVVKGGGQVIYCEKALVTHPSRNVSELLIKRQRIIGGTWDAQLATSGAGAKLHFCWRLLKMFLGRSKKVLTSPSLSTQRRIQLVYLLLQIMTISLAELIKLMWGKEANRV
ncbi:glycosyltransferase [Paraglaciecola polaris]|uniref:Dolichyl-phosphate mannose synthase related protein n=1 Tax=Paraglaciecola polaris LMG 21857 TaxID=1129793 RepID=K6ZPM7_9ALTE|nr:glycosyltransferase family A protein [Paraglaciecola polaris]GAC32252.1 dolichyl-phosphate mannose synthase related protein [Paraglaciecola polaris LMG 21857]